MNDGAAICTPVLSVRIKAVRLAFSVGEPRIELFFCCRKLIHKQLGCSARHQMIQDIGDVNAGACYCQHPLYAKKNQQLTAKLSRNELTASRFYKAR
ncbi:MAG: hypothetical protein QNJ46_19215 [Leptolyngbyaceae cyanobacterium MO_188.B28]|nr:hypothetical protein [Leptolyngbyaceae cyanobacterium MO_188.B28]